MTSMFVHAHSGFRWIVLILLVAATFKALLKWRSKAPYTQGDQQLNLFTMIAVHIQFLLGLVLFFTSERVIFSAESMKVPITRFYTVEHSVMMILAIALVTIGYSKSKKAVEEELKFKTAFYYFLISLVIILAGIPWPFRGFGAGWF